MAKQLINIGQSANDRSGDPLRVAFNKINANFNELYSATGADVQIPDQTGNAGKILTTDGAQLSWETAPSATTDRLTNGALEVILDDHGSLNTPLLLPTSFTAYLDADHYNGVPNPNPLSLTSAPWYYGVSFEVDPSGVTATYVDNNRVWDSLPNYPDGAEFEFTEADHGIPGYVLTITVINTVDAQPAGWAANISCTTPPTFPSTIKTDGAIKLTSNGNDWRFGTDGNLTLPEGGIIKNSDGTQYGGSGGASVTESDTAPSSPNAGDLWYDTTGGRMYVYYDNAWVDSNPANDPSTVSTGNFTFSDNTLFATPANTLIGTDFNTNPPGHTVTFQHNGGVDGGSGGELKFDYGSAKIKVVQDAGITQVWDFSSAGSLTIPGFIQHVSTLNYIQLNDTDSALSLVTEGNNAVNIKVDTNNNNYTWTFDTTGSTKVPGAIMYKDSTDATAIHQVDNSVVLQAKTADNSSYSQVWSNADGTASVVTSGNGQTESSWTFNTDGSLSLPNSGSISNLLQGETTVSLTPSQLGQTVSSISVEKSAPPNTDWAVPQVNWTITVNSVTVSITNITQDETYVYFDVSEPVTLPMTGSLDFVGGSPLITVSPDGVTTWIFGNDGTFNLPLAVNGKGVIQTTGDYYFNANGAIYNLGADGTLTLPGDVNFTYGGAIFEGGHGLSGRGWRTGLNIVGSQTTSTDPIRIYPSGMDGKGAGMGAINVKSDRVEIYGNLQNDSVGTFWTFGQDGSTTFPDSTIQTTAYPGAITEQANTVLAGPATTRNYLYQNTGVTLSGWVIDGVNTDNTQGNPGPSVKLDGNGHHIYANFGTSWYNKTIEFDIMFAENGDGGLVFAAASNGGSGIGLRLNQNGPGTNNGLASSINWFSVDTSVNDDYDFIPMTWYNVKVVIGDGNAGSISYYINDVLLGDNGPQGIEHPNYYYWGFLCNSGTVWVDNIKVYQEVATGATSFRALVAADLPEIDVSTLTGTTLAPNVTNSSLTSVGQLTNLVVTGTVDINSTEDSINADTGALQVAGGVTVGKNLIAEGTIYAGKDSYSEALTNPLIVASSPANVSGGYSQVAILNNTAEASGDYQVFVDGYDVNVSDTGWSDLGYAGSNFSDERYTITNPGDGYVFVSGLQGSTNGGNLVLATDGSGTSNDIVFATGGFTTDKERMRFNHADNKFYIGNGDYSADLEVTGNTTLQNTNLNHYGLTNAVISWDNTNRPTWNAVINWNDPDNFLIVSSPSDFKIETSSDGIGTPNMWTFGADGKIHLPEDGDIVDSNGTSVFSSTYTLPTATTDTLGGVKVDGSTIIIVDGVISSTGGGSGGYSLPTASTGTLGGVKIDGSTITINNEVISAVIPTNISYFTNDSGYLTSVTTITGNAGTATKLATARNINGVAFDGTGDITVTAAAGTLTGNTLNAGITGSSLTSVGTLVNLTVTNPITGSVTGSAGSVAASALTGNTLASGVTSSSLTSVGTLTNLTVTNPIVGTVQNGVVTTGSYSDPSWITSLAYSKLTGTPTIPTTVTINGTAVTLGSSGTVTADASTLTGTTLNSTVVSSSLTSVGTLTGLTVSGTISRQGNVNSSAWLTNGIGLKLPASTFTDTTSSGSISTVNMNTIAAPTLAFSNATTVAQANTLYIGGAPIAGTNATLTSTLALQVASGNAYFAGNVKISGYIQSGGGASMLYVGNSSITVNGDVTVTGNVLMANRPAFRVYGAGTTNNLSTTQNTNGILNSNNYAVDYQQGTALNTSTGVFTAPVAGLYSIHLNARVTSNTAPAAQVCVVKNYATTNTTMVMWETAANPTTNHFGVSTIAKLAVNDTLVVKVTTGSINFDANDSWAVAFIG